MCPAIDLQLTDAFGFRVLFFFLCVPFFFLGQEGLLFTFLVTVPCFTHASYL